MVTKAIIESVDSPYQVTVRIPLFNSSSNFVQGTDILNKAIICIPPNCSFIPEVGDIVLVAFEDFDAGKPIIIGCLFKESGNTSTINLNAESLNIEGTTTLSNQVKIGNITYKELECLKGCSENIQQSLNNISVEAGGLTDVQVNGSSITSAGVANLITKSTYNASTNKIATEIDVPVTTDTVTQDSTAALTSGGAYTALLKKPNYEVDSSSASSISVLLNTIYPIGSVRLSINANETSFMGGTWVLVSEGRALFGAGKIEPDGSIPASGSTTALTYSADSQKNASLPNIVGSMKLAWNDTTGGGTILGTEGTGAFYKSTTGTSYFGNSGNTTGSQSNTLNMDASRSNSIYTNDATVQPNAYIVYVYKRTA